MKIRIIIITLLLCGGLLSAQAQLYQTSGTANYTPAVSEGNAYNTRSVYPAVSSSMPAIETPYSDPRFSSTAVMNDNTYTIMFSAQSMSAGVAQEPAYISPIYKAPPSKGGPGGWIDPGKGPGDISIDITPVGDGTWVLLLCLVLCLSLRAYQVHRTKRV